MKLFNCYSLLITCYSLLVASYLLLVASYSVHAGFTMFALNNMPVTEKENASPNKCFSSVR